MSAPFVARVIFFLFVHVDGFFGAVAQCTLYFFMCCFFGVAVITIYRHVVFVGKSTPDQNLPGTGYYAISELC